MNIVDFAIRRPVAMIMMVLLLVVLGGFSYAKINLDMLPRVDFPIITVSTAYPGANPQNVETLISKPIEDAVTSVTGIDTLKSDSLEGFSNVIIEFNEDVNVDTAAADVREKVSAIRNKLPADAKEPIILKLDINALPIMSLAITADRPTERVYALAKDVIKDELQQVEGVADVDFIGAREREILLTMKPEIIKEFGLSPYAIAGLIAQKTLNLPSGHITRTEREFSVRLEGEFTSIEEIRQTEITLRNGKALQLRELADIRDTYEEYRQGVRMNGKSCIAMIIKKRSDANSVRTANLVKARIAELQQKLPSDVAIRIVRDRSQFIIDSVNDLNGNLITGILITAVILFLFLHSFKLTMIAMISIPVSIIATYTLMFFFNFSINMMTLMALANSVGILVSNAIVVLENIFVTLQKNSDAHAAAAHGTSEILVAVAGATLTNVVVFLPIAFMEGMIGRFFYEFGLTVTFATFISLIMAFTITPMAAAHLLTPQDADLTKKNRLGQLWDKAYAALAEDYRSAIDWCLRHKIVTFVLTGLLMGSTFLLAPFIGFEFVTDPDQREFDITVELPSGSSLAKTAGALQAIEATFASHPHIISVFTKLGKTESMVGGSTQGTHLGEISVKLATKDRFPMSTDQFIQSITPAMAAIPDIKLNMRKTGIMGTAESELQIDVTGDDPEILRNVAAKVLEITRQTPGTRDVISTQKTGKPEWTIRPRREQMARFGMTESALAMQLRSFYEGLVLSTFREKDDEYDIRCKLPETERNDLQYLQQLLVLAPTGKAIPLAQLVDLTEGTGEIQIKRKARNKLINISGNVAGRSLGEIVTDIQRQTSAIQLPVGTNITYSGAVKRMKESFTNLLTAMGLAVVFTYILLAGLLESFIHPVTILLSFPLAFGGIFLGLFLAGQTLSIFSLMAVVMLVGIVVNNGILLLERYRLLQSEGQDLATSVVNGSPLELRPIIMTTIAAVSAMVPQALGLGAGGEMRASMATVSIGGLLVSAFLSIFIIPLMYVMVESAKASLSSWYQHFRSGL